MGHEGLLIADRYLLEHKLGEGAMGSVWRARHLTLGSWVAIKLIRQEALARNPRSLMRFEREAVTAARINSSHVVKVIDHGYHGELPFMVMEYLEGQSLRARLGERGRLSLEETALVVRHVCRALTHAHALGLVHRDIKPENIFITPGEEHEEVVKVLDFGIAKVTDELLGASERPTATGAFLGTPHYMSPEQAYGLKSVGPASDLWSLGVVTFECITGQRPFRAAALAPLIAAVTKGPIPSPSELLPGLPPAVDSWMARALAREPQARFAHAREMADAFGEAVGLGFSTTARHAYGLPPDPPTNPMPHGDRGPAMAAAAFEATQAYPQEPPAAARAGSWQSEAQPAWSPAAAPPPAAQPWAPPAAPAWTPAPPHAAGPAPGGTYPFPPQHHFPPAQGPGAPIETNVPVSSTLESANVPAAIPKSSVMPLVAVGALVVLGGVAVGLWLAQEPEPAVELPASAAPAEPATSAEPVTSAEPAESASASATASAEAAPPPPPTKKARPASDPEPKPGPKPEPKPEPKPKPKPQPTDEPWTHRKTL